VQLAGMLIILGVWVWNSRAWGSESSRMALLVVLCMIAAFLAGVLVRIALGSYRAVQESGFIGAGRIAAVAVLTYGMLRRGLFSPQARVRTLGLYFYQRHFKIIFRQLARAQKQFSLRAGGRVAS